MLRLLRQARQRGTPAAKSPDGICRLVYRSQGRLSGPQALALLMQCQGNNARNGVTGMLIHDGDRFIQVLEAAPAPDEAAPPDANANPAAPSTDDPMKDIPGGTDKK